MSYPRYISFSVVPTGAIFPRDTDLLPNFHTVSFKNSFILEKIDIRGISIFGQDLIFGTFRVISRIRIWTGLKVDSLFSTQTAKCASRSVVALDSEMLAGYLGGIGCADSFEISRRAAAGRAQLLAEVPARKLV